LKNHLGEHPTRFVQKRDDKAAFMRRDDPLHFGYGEGFMAWQGDSPLASDQTHMAPRQGPALFRGDYGTKFRAERWEL
jgi:hypothetical protein